MEGMEEALNVEAYALQVLAKAGCDCHTYDGEYANHLMDDLKTGYPDGMKYPYVDVANAILAISRPRPIVRKPWMVIYDTDSVTDGIGCDSFEDAKDTTMELFCSWMNQERGDWKIENNEYAPTDEQKDNWNYMIETCHIYVQKYNAYKDEYEDYWDPDNEGLIKIGWVMYEEC